MSYDQHALAKLLRTDPSFSTERVPGRPQGQTSVELKKRTWKEVADNHTKNEEAKR